MCAAYQVKYLSRGISLHNHFHGIAEDGEGGDGRTRPILPGTQSSGWTQFYVTLTNDPTAVATNRPIPRDKNGIPLVRVNMHSTPPPKGAALNTINDVGVSLTITVASENGNSQVSVRGVFH